MHELSYHWLRNRTSERRDCRSIPPPEHVAFLASRTRLCSSSCVYRSISPCHSFLLSYCRTLGRCATIRIFCTGSARVDARVLPRSTAQKHLGRFRSCLFGKTGTPKLCWAYYSGWRVTTAWRCVGTRAPVVVIPSEAVCDCQMRALQRCRFINLLLNEMTIKTPI